MHLFQELHGRCIDAACNSLKPFMSISSAERLNLCLKESLLFAEREHQLSGALISSLKNCIVAFFKEIFFSTSSIAGNSILKDQVEPFINQYINPWLDIVGHYYLTGAWNLAYYSVLLYLLDYRY